MRVEGRDARVKEKPTFRTRACPRDGTPLVENEVAVFGPDVKVDNCPKCAGVFLDKNELKRLTGDAELNRYLRDHVGYDVDSKLICPSCGGLMDMEETSGVEVEVCLTCFGLWLDNGELEALNARKSGAPAMTPQKRAELDKAKGADSNRLKAERKKAGLLRPVKPLDDLFDENDRRWL